MWLEIVSSQLVIWTYGTDSDGKFPHERPDFWVSTCDSLVISGALGDGSVREVPRVEPRHVQRVLGEFYLQTIAWNRQWFGCKTSRFIFYSSGYLGISHDSLWLFLITIDHPLVLESNLTTPALESPPRDQVSGGFLSLTWGPTRHQNCSQGHGPHFVPLEASSVCCFFLSIQL